VFLHTAASRRLFASLRLLDPEYQADYEEGNTKIFDLDIFDIEIFCFLCIEINFFLADVL
jgi:hypothetical protein